MSSVTIPVLLAVVLWKVIPTTTLDCFFCNSLDDDSCLTKPWYIHTCPTKSIGCVKMITIDYANRYKFTNAGLQKDGWNDRNITRQILPQAVNVIVRKCARSKSNDTQKPGCAVVRHKHANATMCMCKCNLCNAVTALHMNLPFLICLCAVLKILF